MTVREIKQNELSELLELYTHLHELGVPENSKHLQNTWAAICNDKNHHIIVCETDGKLDTILQEKGNCCLYEKLGYHQTGKTEQINDKMTIVYYEKD